MHPQVLLEASAALLAQVLKFEHPADSVVSKFFRDNKNMGPRERATLAETTYNVLRKKLLFEAFANGAPKGSGSRERKLAILGFAAPRDFVKIVLSDQEKAWLDACDQTDPAAPNSGLLDLHRHNLPEWLATTLKAQLGAEFWPLATSLNQAATMDVRVNTFKKKPQDVSAIWSKNAIKNKACTYSPWGLRLEGKPLINKTEAFINGEVEVQDEGSQLLALILDAKRGEMVVDFCAGAGGKTLAIGAAMRGTGRLYAFDTSAHRLESMKSRLARSGLQNVHQAAIAHERDERVKRLSGKIDRVIVDAPCSGLGTLRRNPDMKWRQSPQTVLELMVKQKAILESAARLLKPGGRLVYATCSLLPEENEGIADAFSAAHPEFTQLPVADILTELKVPQAESLCAGLNLRLWPHRHGTDGFFASVWQRNIA
jgi:16S rRNA (cytosine967-C5)-methyltransferase